MSAFTRIFSRFDDDGHALVRMERVTSARLPFGKERAEAIELDSWSLEAPGAAMVGVARVVNAWLEDETGADGTAAVGPTPENVRLAPELVSRLTEAEARALGLPPAAPVSLNLAARDLLTNPGFRIDTTWTRANGVPARVEVEGARLRLDGNDHRLIAPLRNALNAAERVNAATDPATKQACFAELRASLSAETDAPIRADDFIEGLRLSYAAAVSLALKVQNGSVDFDPVPFGRYARVRADDGAVLDEAADALLPPTLQADFAARFRKGDGRKRGYLLGDGSLLFVDPALAPAMALIRAKQAAPSDERRAFARSPRRAIREAMGDAADGAEALFIETAQFSERVLDVDLWVKPVLPWIVPRAETWLPERFGLRIGDGDDAVHIGLAPKDVGPAIASVGAAIAAGRETASIAATPADAPEGAAPAATDVPATPQTLQALEALCPFVGVREDMEDWQVARPPPPPELHGRYFLQVRDNLTEVDYAPLLATADPADAPRAEPPPTLVSTLKPHQVAGFAWLVAAWRAGLPGVLLADDMGLGKTFQALAFLAWLRGDQPMTGPCLVVAPTGLLANWEKEIELHLKPSALGAVVRAFGKGLADARTGAGRDIELGGSRLDTARWRDAAIVLTTYETMRDYHMSFAATRFAAVIFDEAQKLKNPASQMTRAAKTLNARLAIAMTGTPVENRLQDLWSILDVVYPSYLGSSRAFEAAHPAHDVEKLRALNSKLTEGTEARPPVMLRRMKADHIEGLPRKSEIKLEVTMPPAQARAYSTVVARALGLAGSGTPGFMLEILHALRGVSLHPRPPTNGGDDPDAYAAESARLRGLYTTLDTIHAAQEKALIFCESLDMGALLAAHLRRRYRLAADPPRIHGGVSGEARQRAVDTFQQRGPGFDVMVLSPKAGGVGLTLTAANHVIHLSRWWNPAVEDQATDRVYRIGQTREVKVYLPQAVHPDPALAGTSFDLKLDQLMSRKRALAQGLLIVPESPDDASALFESVTRPVAEQAEPPPPADNRVHRSLSTPPPPAPDTGPLVVLASARRRFASGERRDFTIFEQRIGGAEIEQLDVQDPWICASPRQRGQVIDFVAAILGVSRGIARVQLVGYDAESLDGRESAQAQRDDMVRRWRQRFGTAPELKLTLVSIRAVPGLHDRSVTARLRTGKQLGWDLGSGVSGLMATERECTVSSWDG